MNRIRLDSQSVGRALRMLREANGFRLKDLVEMSHHSIGYLSEIERGVADPPIDVIDCLFSLLGAQVALEISVAPGPIAEAAYPAPAFVIGDLVTMRASARTDRRVLQVVGLNLRHDANTEYRWSCVVTSPCAPQMVIPEHLLRHATQREIDGRNCGACLHPDGVSAC